MKKHQSHPTGSKPFPEVNGTFVQKTRKNQGYRYEKKMEKKRAILQKATYHTTRSGDTMNSNKKMIGI
jgi:hypothetical protein